MQETFNVLEAERVRMVATPRPIRTVRISRNPNHRGREGGQQLEMQGGGHPGVNDVAADGDNRGEQKPSPEEPQRVLAGTRGAHLVGGGAGFRGGRRYRFLAGRRWEGRRLRGR